MRLLAVDRIEYRDGIVAHFGERVIDIIKLARQADVSVVESDDLEPFVAEELTPWHGVDDTL